MLTEPRYGLGEGQTFPLNGHAKALSRRHFYRTSSARPQGGIKGLAGLHG